MLNEFYDLIASDMVYKICNSSKEENKLGISKSFIEINPISFLISSYCKT